MAKAHSALALSQYFLNYVTISFWDCSPLAEPVNHILDAIGRGYVKINKSAAWSMRTQSFFAGRSAQFIRTRINASSAQNAAGWAAIGGAHRQASKNADAVMNSARVPTAGSVLLLAFRTGRCARPGSPALRQLETSHRS